MKDFLHKILKTVDYERGKVIGILLAVALFAFIYGCQVKIPSPISGNEVVVSGTSMTDIQISVPVGETTEVN